MSIHVAWYSQEQRILLLTFPHTWNWDTFGAAYREALEMTQDIKQPVDVILDMRQVSRLPAHALNHAVRISNRWGNHFGRVVFVTDQMTLLPFGQAARNIIPRARRQAHHSTTVAQAVTRIQTERERAAYSSYIAV